MFYICSMKKIRITLFLVLLFAIASSFTVHKFYIGVFQVDYKSEKKEFQITSRVFIDDIEKAFETKYKKKINFDTKQEIKESNDLIAQYFKEKLKISVNNKEQELIFVTKEYDDDVMVCYHKISYSGKIKSAGITNTILTEQFSEQQNLLHTNINSNKQSFLFTNSNIKEKIEF